MKNISAIIIHCSATFPRQDVNIETIREWHLFRGFNDIGYHFVIELDGAIESGRPLNKVGAHAQGHNVGTIGICYVGGLDCDGLPKDTRTIKQVLAMNRLVYWLAWKFEVKNIFGHNLVSDKACPCFDAQKEYLEKVQWMSQVKGMFDEVPGEPYSLCAVY